MILSDGIDEALDAETHLFGFERIGAEMKVFFRSSLVTGLHGSMGRASGQGPTTTRPTIERCRGLYN